VPVRIVAKDQTNECNLFSARVTVAREVSNAGAQNRPSGPAGVIAQPRNAADARDAFARLFKI